MGTRARLESDAGRQNRSSDRDRSSPPYLDGEPDGCPGLPRKQIEPVKRPVDQDHRHPPSHGESTHQAMRTALKAARAARPGDRALGSPPHHGMIDEKTTVYSRSSDCSCGIDHSLSDDPHIR